MTIKIISKLGEKFIERPKVSIGWSWQIIISSEANYTSRDSASRAMRKFKYKHKFEPTDREDSIFIYVEGGD